MTILESSRLKKSTHYQTNKILLSGMTIVEELRVKKTLDYYNTARISFSLIDKIEVSGFINNLSDHFSDNLFQFSNPI